MKQRKEITPENALARLETLCARSEQCTHDLSCKLRRWGIPAIDSQKIIDSLTERKFVDNCRFARSFVNDKSRFCGYGRIKIRLALMARHIPSRIIDEALEAIDQEEYESTLRRLLSVRASHMNDLGTYEGRTRLYRYGVGRGYESSLVASALRSLIKDIMK